MARLQVILLIEGEVKFLYARLKNIVTRQEKVKAQTLHEPPHSEASCLASQEAWKEFYML